MHELPSRHSRVVVAGPEPWRSEAWAFLVASGRDAVLAETWIFSEQSAIQNQKFEIRNPQAKIGRLWQPNEFLIEVSERLTLGRALDLACGTGRDSVELASTGWQVVAVDHLQDALDRGRDLARRYLSPEEAARIEWIRADLDVDPKCSVLGARRFGLASMFWYLNRDLIADSRDLLAEEGSLVIETFTTVHRERFGKPRREHFALRPGELRELVQPLEIVAYEEGWHGDRHSARVWARRS